MGAIAALPGSCRHSVALDCFDAPCCSWASVVHMLEGPPRAALAQARRWGRVMLRSLPPSACCKHPKRFPAAVLPSRTCADNAFGCAARLGSVVPDEAGSFRFQKEMDSSPGLSAAALRLDLASAGAEELRLVMV